MVATHRMTIAEFEALPLEGTWELIDGEPVEMSPSAGESGWIAVQIAFFLEAHVRAQSLGWIFSSEVGFVLFEDRATVRSPDVSFVRRDRLPKPPRSFVQMAPDLAVEVLSPSDRIPEALAKVTMYLQAGVQLVWLVDPLELSVTVFRPDASPKTVGRGDTLEGGEVLPGFQLPLAAIFNLGSE